MSIKIFDTVSAVLLADGWHKLCGEAFYSITSDNSFWLPEDDNASEVPDGGELYFEFGCDDGIIHGPLSSVLAIRIAA